MSRSDNSDLLLIDLEYAGWNPMAMDLAVYMNETMIDNSHQGLNGVKVYKHNKMSEEEEKKMILTYLTYYFDNYMPAQLKQNYSNAEDYIEKNYVEFRK